MANTIAEATGIDSRRIKETHRLGSVAAETTAATWRTFVKARVNADGSGWVSVERDGKSLQYIRLEPESQ